MKNYIIAVLSMLMLSCNQSSSQLEKDYIRNLEEKNKALEMELKELKDESEAADKTGRKSGLENSSEYFTIGSTEDEVIEIMGEPTSYLKTAPEARKFHYGLSAVYFYQGKVISFDNLQGNLKVRVK